jgi:hypothetical protein
MGLSTLILILTCFQFLSYFNIIPLFGIIILIVVMVPTACKGEASNRYTFSFMHTVQLSDDGHQNQPKHVNIKNIQYSC